MTLQAQSEVRDTKGGQHVTPLVQNWEDPWPWHCTPRWAPKSKSVMLSADGDQCGDRGRDCSVGDHEPPPIVLTELTASLRSVRTWTLAWREESGVATLAKGMSGQDPCNHIKRFKNKYINK